MNGDYAGIISRLRDDRLVSMLICKFLDSVEYGDCGKAIAERDWKTAFMAAHTLKGVALNLSFTDLAKATSDLTELLRPQTVNDPSEAEALYAVVTEKYNATISAIKEFKDAR